MLSWMVHSQKGKLLRRHQIYTVTVHPAVSCMCLRHAACNCHAFSMALLLQAAAVDLYVADRFIGWQETALQFMALHLTDGSNAGSFGKLTGPLLDEVQMLLGLHGCMLHHYLMTNGLISCTAPCRCQGCKCCMYSSRKACCVVPLTLTVVS